MTLRTSLLRQLANPDLNRNSRALLRCKLAREQEDRGNYEDAREIIGELWQRIGEHPKVEKLEPSTAAEVLLRAGVLTGWIGDKQQIPDAQETAKNLISESATIFESLGAQNKILEAQTELAYCYWREGALDESRIILREVLAHLKDDDELRAKAVLRSALVERAAKRYREAFRILTNAAPLFERIINSAVKGSYHNELAIVLRNLSVREKRDDYIDRAFIEYTAAGFHFEDARHKCYSANVENNLGFLHFKAGRFKEAHRHLERARRLLVSIKDKGTIAQVDETRARVYLAESNYKEAERVARAAVCALEQGGRQSLLAEALTTHGRALFHLGYHQQAQSILQRALKLAQVSGAPTREAEDQLKRVKEHLAQHQEQTAGSVLSQEMHRYEGKLIKDALTRAQGSITQAAQLLGVTHQCLSYILENRHRELLPYRTPKRERLKRK